MNKRLLFILGLFLFRMPYGLSGISYVYSALIVIMFFISLSSVINNFKRSSRSTQFIYLALIVAIVFPYISRFINGYGFDLVVVRDFLLTIGLTNLFVFSFQKNFWSNMKVVDNVLSFFVIINFFSIVLFPDGMFVSEDSDRRVWILGIKNHIIRTIIPALAISYLVSQHYYNRIAIRTFVVYIISALSILLTNSSTAIVVIFFEGIGLFFLKRVEKIKMFNIRNVFFVYLCISILVVVVGIQSQFSYYIEMLFEKDASMSGRVPIWEYTIVRVSDSPVIGFGYQRLIDWREVLGLFYLSGGSAAHPHNFLLFTLMNGGIILVIIYIILFCIITRYSLYSNNKQIYVLTFMYSCFFIGGITESLTNAPLLLPLFGLYASLMEQAQTINVPIGSCLYENSR